MVWGVQGQAAECISEVKRKDTGTLQYDRFISSDNTECEIREAYENSDALLAHIENLREPLRMLFEKFATDHSVVIYGDPSAQLLENEKSINRQRMWIHYEKRIHCCNYFRRLLYFWTKGLRSLGIIPIFSYKIANDS